ncbi:MAG: hydroxymethylglutaryl-CoA lyase, partial [Albidovulum sp.]
FRPIALAASVGNVKLRGYVSVVTDCPYDGPTSPDAVARVVALLRDLGCYEISLGDTIGHGRPETIDAMLAAVLNEMPPERLAGHYHDTGQRALANIEASLARGLRVFDAAVGGLGGCPYAPGAAGNVASEAVDLRLKELEYETGLDAAILAEASALARAMRGKTDG